VNDGSTRTNVVDVVSMINLLVAVKTDQDNGDLGHR
jgi:hypothetical protein